jgi:4-hydroxy-tetrahydrodipicolinate synthase
MPFQPGLVHAPVTPFTREHRIDFDLYGKLIAFHLAHGADALAIAMHAGESVSLSDQERRELLEYAIKAVAGRRPIIAHVSEAGTGVAAALARHAEAAGAAAIVATTPYYWTPPPAMVLEHFAQIGGAVGIPFFVYNAPEEMAGSRINTDLALKLIARLPNFAGVVDSSLDWQFMIELMTEAPKVRPDFALLAGNELMVSASAIGATGMITSLAAIAPKRVRQLFELCRTQELFEAREVQEEIAALHQVLKPGGVAALKAAMRAMGRDCGVPRPPNLPLGKSADAALGKALGVESALRNEPRGW